MTMARIRDMGRRARALAVVLLLLPFLAAQLFAPGTMPGDGADGLVVQLCTSDGVVRSVVIGADGVPRPVDEQPSDDHRNACPWAAVARVFVDQDAPAVPVPVLAEGRADLPVPRGQVLHASPPGVPQARAPPVAA